MVCSAGFSKVSTKLSPGPNAYGNSVARLVRIAAIVLVIYAGLLVLTGFGFSIVPARFSPAAGSRLRHRVCPVARRRIARAHPGGGRQDFKIARETPGVLNTVEFTGLNIFGGLQPNTAAVFLPFKDLQNDNAPEQGLPGILAKVTRGFARDSGSSGGRLSAAAGCGHWERRRLQTLHPGSSQRRPRRTAGPGVRHGRES